MNRVILMGRLTRDPEVRYSQGERSMQLPDTLLQWTEGDAGARTAPRSSRQPISSTALHGVRQVNLSQDISKRAV